MQNYSDYGVKTAMRINHLLKMILPSTTLPVKATG